jgi:hypothetical protein
MWLEYGGLSVLTARLGDHRAAKRGVGCGLVTVFGPSACVSPGRPIVTRPGPVRCGAGRGGPGRGGAVQSGAGQSGAGQRGAARGSAGQRGPGRGGAGRPVQSGAVRARASRMPRLTPRRLTARANGSVPTGNLEPPRHCGRWPRRAGGSDLDRQQQPASNPKHSDTGAPNRTKTGSGHDDAKAVRGARRPLSVKNSDVPRRIATPGAHLPRPGHRADGYARQAATQDRQPRRAGVRNHPPSATNRTAGFQGARPPEQKYETAPGSRFPRTGGRQPWRCRESNPGPSLFCQGFSERSSLCLYSAPPFT